MRLRRIFVWVFERAGVGEHAIAKEEPSVFACVPDGADEFVEFGGIAGEHVAAALDGSVVDERGEGKSGDGGVAV